MKFGKREISAKQLRTHETKQHALMKFLLVASVLVIYFFFVAFKYGVQDGLLISALTWSFFVLCTPVADAGFLLDFPIRLITNFRMFYSEIIVWGLAIAVNVYTFFFADMIYDKTVLLRLFLHILQQPFPFWSIIAVSGLGTFLSIHFGDELMDVAKHKQRKKYSKHHKKQQLIIMVFIFVVTLILYDFLLKKLGVDVPL